ncbi:MAG: tetratricopeptide repeat protein [Lewinellaceae bacterium]|nr:tetratricopeptide repeat protein [Lewinellaceae bacterium]
MPPTSAPGMCASACTPLRKTLCGNTPPVLPKACNGSPGSPGFHDETLDGWNRYMALVRLTFIYYNYRQFRTAARAVPNPRQPLFPGKYYSKRLLTNYYGNRLLLHNRFQEYDEAEYYGYLSVRVKTADYIHYVNNLCGVLLRRKKYTEALQVMKTALPESRTTHSFHNKIGFVAHYLRCLHHTGQHRAAENYADAYLRAYRKEILSTGGMRFQRLHRGVAGAKQLCKILRLTEKYHLLERDRAYAESRLTCPRYRGFTLWRRIKQAARHRSSCKKIYRNRFVE